MGESAGCLIHRHNTTIDGHNRRWIDGSIPMVSINTFGLIFIDVIDPLVKDFLFDR